MLSILKIYNYDQMNIKHNEMEMTLIPHIIHPTWRTVPGCIV